MSRFSLYRALYNGAHKNGHRSDHPATLISMGMSVLLLFYFYDLDTQLHTPTLHTRTLYFPSRSKTKLLCIYTVGNCPYCTILAMMCSHLSKSMEPRNWYYSFNGLFSLSPSLSISLPVPVFAHAWMRKSDYLRKKGVSMLVKGGSCVSAVSVKRPVYNCRPPAHLLSALSRPLLFWL